MLHPDRYLDPDPAIRPIARELYERVRELPLVCPHGHVDPRLLAENDPFPDPTELIIIPDHYVFRMLYSQGVRLEALGIPAKGAGLSASAEERRRIWQIFGDHFYLFRGTPTAAWLGHELAEVFGIDAQLDGSSAMAIYDDIADRLATAEFLPRAMFDRFRIEVLCTTDAATDTLEHHQKIRDSGWSGRVRPTFRPDRAIDILAPGWTDEIDRLGDLTGKEIGSYASLITALEERRTFFRSMGATATDHGVTTPFTCILEQNEAEAIFQRARAGEASDTDRRHFVGHLLVEMARMSVEDSLVMQLHPGSFRNHNTALFDAFGPDMGSDIPLATEFTRNLHPLLGKFADNPNLTLVLFTLDESTYSRELAPLAGHYPAVRLGPPWWFHDSREGMRRFRERVTETAGIYNTAGFNDDTRAFPSIPARHDLARRIDASFLAKLVAEHVIDETAAAEMVVDLAYNLVRSTYRLDGSSEV